MQQYLSLIEEVLKTGKKRNNRTKIKTISKFGTQRRYSLKKFFPLLSTKKVHFKSVVHELLWFISGQTNIKYLVDNDVRIWNEWPYQKYQESRQYQKTHTLQWFTNKIKSDSKFAKKWGELGPIYGKQWRDFKGVDQLKKLIENLQKDPNSRRMIISAWNPPLIDKMALPPCHTLMQFYVDKGYLSCHLYQRSGDVFLGVPFNIASYALLTYMISHVSNLKPGEFIHTIGDTHIYQNHLSQVKEQLKRKPKKLPQLKLNPQIKNLFDFKFEDIELLNYDPYPIIKGKVAI